ncbi:MAG: hypothetical protein OEM93_11180, partial [Rhodospirillales bacterium]|nr:hypothetical protein [Rhodospirillales bacterium]
MFMDRPSLDPSHPVDHNDPLKLPQTGRTTPYRQQRGRSPKTPATLTPRKGSATRGYFLLPLLAFISFLQISTKPVTESTDLSS